MAPVGQDPEAIEEVTIDEGTSVHSSGPEKMGPTNVETSTSNLTEPGLEIHPSIFTPRIPSLLT